MNAAVGQSVQPSAHHVAKLYDGEELLIEELAEFATSALRSDDRLVTIATQARLESLVAVLCGRGIDTDAATATGRWLHLDCGETLEALLRGGAPDAMGFSEAVESPLAKLHAHGGRVRVFGEMVDVLCGRGDYAGAAALEALWNEALTRLPVSLLCAYSMTSFADGATHADFARIRAAHGMVLSAGPADREAARGREETSDLKGMGGTRGRRSNSEPAVEGTATAEHVMQAGNASGDGASHLVTFYDNDASLIAKLADFALPALQSGGAFVAIIRPEHRSMLAAALHERGVDLDAAIATGQCVHLDAGHLLADITRESVPDPAAFAAHVERLLVELCKAHRHVRVFGEMVAMQCEAGDYQGAVRLECLGNELAGKLPVTVLCAYPIGALADEGAAAEFMRVWEAHDHLLNVERGAPPAPAGYAGVVMLLQQHVVALEEEVRRRVKLQRQLSLREQELSVFLEHDAGPTGRVGPGGALLWANRALRELLDIGRAEPPDRNLEDCFAPRQSVREILRRLDRGEKVRNAILHVPAGDRSLRTVRVSAIPWRPGSSSDGAWMTVHDISRKEEVERGLRAEVDTLRALAQATQALTGERNPDALVRTIVDAAVRFTSARDGGFVRGRDESRTGVALSDVDRALFGGLPMPAIARLFAPIFEGERMVRCADLAQHPDLEAGHDGAANLESLPMRSFIAAAVISHTGVAHGALFIGHPEANAFDDRDELIAGGIATQAAFAIENARLLATNRQWRRDLQNAIVQRTEELRRTELHLQTLLAGITDFAIILLDTEGGIVTWNTGGERILGYRAEEVLGSHFSRFYTHEEQEKGSAEAALRIARAQGNHEAEGWRTRKDGSRFWASAVLTPVRDDDGEVIGYAKVIHDMTRDRMADERLQQTQRMEIIGRLTGGIAHDFNNLLTIILGNIESVLRLHPDEAPIREAAERVSTAAERAATLTRQLLAFSRRQALNPRQVNVALLVARMSDMLQRTLGEHVRVHTTLAGNCPCEVDVPQLESAILNLAINSRDAMAGGGSLTLDVSNLHLDGELVGDERLHGDFVSISVTDSGSGMSEEVLERACEPFFTTKPLGQGTGLGLPQVYGFVRQSGGQLALASEPGKGTTIRILLPRCGDAPAVAQPPRRQQEAAALPRGSEPVLVVEDEAGVRQYCAQQLRELGYTVFEAGDASAALRALDEHPEVVLLVTDVGLPGMNGGELADRARERRPDLVVLFASGYPLGIVKQRWNLAPDVELLTKPYLAAQLAQRVRVVLDARRPREAPESARVLLLEDDTTLRHTIGRLLREFGLDVVEASDLAGTRAAIAGGFRPAIAIVDINLGGENGMDAIRDLRGLDAGLPVIITSGYGEPVQRGGTCDSECTAILPKPYTLRALKRAIVSMGIALRATGDDEAPAATPTLAPAAATDEVLPRV